MRTFLRWLIHVALKIGSSVHPFGFSRDTEGFLFKIKFFSVFFFLFRWKFDTNLVRFEWKLIWIDLFNIIRFQGEPQKIPSKKIDFRCVCSVFKEFKKFFVETKNFFECFSDENFDKLRSTLNMNWLNAFYFAKFKFP